MTAGFIYDDIFLRHQTPPSHPESGERLISIANALRNAGLWDRLTHSPPRRATVEEISLVHRKDYIDKIFAFTEGYLNPDTYVSRNTPDVALHAAGAVLTAIDLCLSGDVSRAFCAVRPPGHHAEADRGMGFCIFNNAAVGARYAQARGYRKVFIIDFDVHHGNGTQHIFEEDESVFYFSTHQYPHYPGTGSDSEQGVGKGEGFTYNEAMPCGAGDREYVQIYRGTLPPLVRDFGPDIILVSAGYDVRELDPLSGIRVTSYGIREIVRSILHCGVRNVVFVLEGGYHLRALAESVTITVEEMLAS